MLALCEWKENYFWFKDLRKFIGYRAWRKANRTPLLPFGFGLSYTTFSAKLISADKNSARVKVTNTGDRSGAEVLQIYASRKEGENFERRLAGFAKLELKAGESAEVSIEIEPLVFKKFDKSWRDNDGQWNLTLAPDAFAEGESLPI